MLEDLRENVLTLLEERVERAIDTIHRLREERLALESENNQLRDELDQRDVQIQNLEQRNAELNHFDSELQVLQNEREQERINVDKEKAEVRERLEGLMTMLSNVENRAESQESDQLSAFDNASEQADSIDTPDISEPTDDEETSQADIEEEPEEAEQPNVPGDLLFIPTTLIESQESEESNDSDDTDDETVIA